MKVELKNVDCISGVWLYCQSFKRDDDVVYINFLSKSHGAENEINASIEMNGSFQLEYCWSIDHFPTDEEWAAHKASLTLSCNQTIMFGNPEGRVGAAP